MSAKELIELIKAVHEKGLPFRFRAAGASMSPFIKNGDIITVAPKKSDPIRLGEVVAFIHQGTGRLVVHRVIKRLGSFFLLRGDNTSFEDGLIPSSDVLGVVISVERAGRRVFLGLGVERYVIAFLSQRSLFAVLRKIFSPVSKIVRFSRKRQLP